MFVCLFVCLFVCFCLLVCCEGVYTQLLLLNKQVFYFSKNLHVYTYKLISQVLTASCECDSGFVLPSVQLDCKFRVCLATKPAGISTILPIWTFGLKFYDLINSFTHLAGICCFLAMIIQLLSFWRHGFERDFDPSMSVIWITRLYLGSHPIVPRPYPAVCCLLFYSYIARTYVVVLWARPTSMKEERVWGTVYTNFIPLHCTVWSNHIAEFCHMTYYIINVNIILRVGYLQPLVTLMLLLIAHT